jgi:predicted DNA-binding protein (MmcQ/YjbR family)
MTTKISKAAPMTPRVAALAGFLEAKPGATVFKIRPNVPIYKVSGKMFAILSAKTGYVVLKCAPDSIPMLKAKYTGVGHKTHLDPRHWIAVEIDADVPLKEVQRLASLSYDMVRAPAKAPKKIAAQRVRKPA